MYVYVRLYLSLIISFNHPDNLYHFHFTDEIDEAKIYQVINPMRITWPMGNKAKV